jgi:muramoyltetrapeptide carboxypeptidase
MGLSGVTLPPPVKTGDRVGVAALSGPVDPGTLERGLEAIRELGFEPVAADNLRLRRGLFAGADDERLTAFHDLAADPSVRAILFTRGGHGSLRLLPRIDWSALATVPRAYVGYSDLTPFLLQVVTRLGLVAFHGPMIAGDLARGLESEEWASLERALTGDYPDSVPLESVGGDHAVEGPLLGGCLSLLTATLGTPFAPDLTGSILFWEDVNEPLYRIDRMLSQLALSGSLSKISGMVIGKLELTGEGAGGPDLGSVVQEIAERPEWPVAWGCPSGHCKPNMTLPLGLKARLDPHRNELELGRPTTAGK